MQLLREHIIVKVPSIFFDEISTKSLQKLIVDTTFNPERHVRNYGEVVGVPTELTEVPIAQEHVGAPAYHEYSELGMRAKRASDIKMQIKVGSRVYFHYNCLLPDAGIRGINQYYLKSAMEKVDGKDQIFHYFRVKYELCYATVDYLPCAPGGKSFTWAMEKDLEEIKTPVVDDEETDECQIKKVMIKRYLNKATGEMYKRIVTPIGSWCLVEPDMETWDDVSIPTPMTVDGKVLLGKDGKPMMKPKDQWLVTKSHLNAKYLVGWVRYVGEPLKGDQQEVWPGMYVSFRPLTNTILRFEGFDYFRMIQRNIIAIWPSKSQFKPNEYAKVREHVEAT